MLYCRKHFFIHLWKGGKNIWCVTSKILYLLRGWKWRWRKIQRTLGNMEHPICSNCCSTWMNINKDLRPPQTDNKHNAADKLSVKRWLPEKIVTLCLDILSQFSISYGAQISGSLLTLRGNTLIAGVTMLSSTICCTPSPWPWLCWCLGWAWTGLCSDQQAECWG